MTIVLAIMATIILVGLGIFQLALVLGAPLGRFAWGGQHKKVLPTNLRVGSAISIVLYAVFAMFALDKTGAISALDDSVVNVGAWVITGYLFVGIAMNGMSRSTYERYVMTPIVIVLAVLFLVVALN